VIKIKLINIQELFSLHQTFLVCDIVNTQQPTDLNQSHSEVFNHVCRTHEIDGASRYSHSDSEAII